MIAKSSIAATILEAIEQSNEQLAPGDRLTATLDAPLLGKSGSLDSLSLLTLLTEIERRVEANHNLVISLYDGSLFAENSDVLTRVELLVDYVHRLVEKKQAA
jgi:hypothetical protein